MEIQTTVPIDINVDINATVNKVLKGKINHYVYSNNFSLLEVDGKYWYEENGDEILVKNFVHKMTVAQINALFPTLTFDDTATKVHQDSEVAYQAFKIIMNQTYSVPLNQIEIIE